jgi:protein phosphatase
MAYGGSGLCAHGAAVLVSTDHKVVDLTDPASELDVIEWWTSLTNRGGEGMVAKPFEFIARGRRSLAQPAIKCRGPEYLRIIYGPEYTLPENLDRQAMSGIKGSGCIGIRNPKVGNLEAKA